MDDATITSPFLERDGCVFIDVFEPALMRMVGTTVMFTDVTCLRRYNQRGAMRPTTAKPHRCPCLLHHSSAGASSSVRCMNAAKDGKICRAHTKARRAGVGLERWKKQDDVSWANHLFIAELKSTVQPQTALDSLSRAFDTAPGTPELSPFKQAATSNELDGALKGSWGEVKDPLSGPPVFAMLKQYMPSVLYDAAVGPNDSEKVLRSIVNESMRSCKAAAVFGAKVDVPLYALLYDVVSLNKTPVVLQLQELVILAIHFMKEEGISVDAANLFGIN